MEAVIIDGMAFALPLFIMAIGGIYSEKSGITNLALEGFQGVGAFTGALAVVLIDHFTKFDAQQFVLCCSDLCDARRYGFFHHPCRALHSF